MKFKLTNKQAEFIGAYEQFSAYIGAIGTGKSTALIVKALFHSQESPGNLGVIVRKHFTDLRDSTIKDFETYTGFKVTEQKKECILPNGSTILFRHFEELPVLKNLNLGFFGIEQAEESPDSTVWEFLKMRLRRDCKHRNGFIVGNTAGHNWIWNIWKRYGPPKNHMIVEAKTQEHADFIGSDGKPALPADYIENLKTLPAKLYKRYVENSWDVTEGLVYDEFDSNKHMIDSCHIPDTFERGFVLDHGFRNPTAVLYYAIDYDGNIYLYDEHYESEKPISYHAGVIKSKGILSGWCDPSVFAKTQSRGTRMYSLADEYKDFGITLSPASNSNELASIARVNEFFKADRIKVFKTLSNFEKEITSWKWKEVRPTANSLNLPEVPEDHNNHLMDTLKYLIASRFPATQEPERGPMVKSLNWFKKVESKMSKGFGRKEQWEGVSKI